MKISIEFVLWDENDKDHFIDATKIALFELESKLDTHNAGGVTIAGAMRQKYSITLKNGEVKKFPKNTVNDEAVIDFIFLYCKFELK